MNFYRLLGICKQLNFFQFLLTFQSKKHIKGRTAKTVFIASDAEGKIVSAVTELCRESGIELDAARTKSELGKMCGIDVDCAVCVVLK